MNTDNTARTADATPAGVTRRRIWDPVVRVTHWVVVVSVLAGYFIGENMSFSNISWHFYLGYITGGAVLLRLIWGLVGPKPARIWPLVAQTTELPRYSKTMLKRQPSYWPGHNPIGGLSALALWAVLAGMVVTGLFSESDDFFEIAPLGHLISADARLTMNGLHDTLHVFVLPLVLLHVLAILFYALWKRENLLRPMITGWKQVRGPD